MLSSGLGFRTERLSRLGDFLGRFCKKNISQVADHSPGGSVGNKSRWRYGANGGPRVLKWKHCGAKVQRSGRAANSDANLKDFSEQTSWEPLPLHQLGPDKQSTQQAALRGTYRRTMTNSGCIKRQCQQNLQFQTLKKD
ncbi:hypothetical protein BaRGS_00024900 [Batillaria attramentaria]|uniref:Uncharacterized protein n=1 Tax=Batillaria attramentaria TaxID=370345 RepID=A0ABD0K9V8_9CAEN